MLLFVIRFSKELLLCIYHYRMRSTYISQSVRPSVPSRLSVRPSVRPSVRSSRLVRPSVPSRLFVRPVRHPPVRPSVSPSVRPSVRPIVRPSVCLPVRPIMWSSIEFVKLCYIFKHGLYLRKCQFHQSVVSFSYFVCTQTLARNNKIRPLAPLLPQSHN